MRKRYTEGIETPERQERVRQAEELSRQAREARTQYVPPSIPKGAPDIRKVPFEVLGAAAETYGREIAQPQAGLATAALESLRLPEPGKPLPGTILKDIFDKAKVTKQGDDAGAWFNAIRTATGDYQRARPEAFTGEKFLTEALFDVANLIGIGLEPKIARGVNALWKASVAGGKEAAGAAARAGVAGGEAVGRAMRVERPGARTVAAGRKFPKGATPLKLSESEPGVILGDGRVGYYVGPIHIQGEPAQLRVLLPDETFLELPQGFVRKHPDQAAWRTQWDTEITKLRDPEARALPTEGAGKEPWQMTRAEAIGAKPSGYLEARKSGATAGQYQLYYTGTRNLVEETADQTFRTPTDAKRIYMGIKHRKDVSAALSEGKPVPPEVLADYPDLRLGSQGLQGNAAVPVTEGAVTLPASAEAAEAARGAGGLRLVGEKTPSGRVIPIHREQITPEAPNIDELRAALGLTEPRGETLQTIRNRGLDVGAGRVPPREPMPLEPGVAAVNEANPERHTAWRMRNEERMSPLLRKSLTERPETHEVFPDVARKAAADAMIAADSRGLLSRLLATDNWTDVEVIASGKLIRRLYESGAADEGEALARKLAQNATPTARRLRAYASIEQLSPEGVVVMTERNIQKLLEKKNAGAAAKRIQELAEQMEVQRIRAEAAEQLAVVRGHRQHRVNVERTLTEAIAARRPLTIKAFREGIESLMTDEAGAIRLSRRRPIELPLEAMEPLYDDALRIKAMPAGPEKEVARQALRAQMDELEATYRGAQQEMAAFTQMDKAVDKWNAHLAAQDAAKLAREQKQAVQQAVGDANVRLKVAIQAAHAARKVEKKAATDAAMLARRELVVARKELNVLERAEEKAARFAERQERQLSYITDADARTIQKRIQTDEQQAINFLRKQVRSGDIDLDRILAQNFFDRAKALQSLPDPDRFWAAKDLMHDIAKIIPSSRWDTTVNILGLSRSFKAAMDLSFLLRQGAFQWTRKEWRDMFGTQIKAFASEDVARAAENRVLFGPLGKVRAESGLEFVDRAGPLFQLEETFFSEWASKVPLIEQSERAYITAGNVLRADVWDGIVRKWLPPDMQGRAFDSLDELIQATGKTRQDFENLSKWLNVTTGRGDIPWLRSNIKLLNALFFAPRFFVSRLQVLPTAAQIAVQSPALRLEVARDLVGFVAGNMALLALLKASGVGEVELDHRSSDFGKGRIGPVRFDFWGGFQPIARYTAQFISGEGKSTGTGRIYPKERIVGEGGRGTLFDFIRAKLSPSVGTGVDILPMAFGKPGQTITGEMIRTPQDIAREIAADFVPFIGGTIWNAWKESESIWDVGKALPVTIAMGAAELFGGASTAYHSLRDVQDRKAQAGDYKDAYSNKAQRYLDLSKSDREAVDASDEVKAELALLEAREGGRKPKYIEALETWEQDKTELEAELRKHIDGGASGDALRDAIRFMNEGRYQRGQSVFKPDVVREMESGIVKDAKDVLRDQYWSAEVPKDYQTGDLDFKARDKVRAEVLAKADQLGVSRSYILDRGQRFKDPEVRRVMVEYDADMETLRPYWEIQDDVEAAMPDKLEAYRERVITFRRAVMKKNKPEIRKALEKWGYTEKKEQFTPLPWAVTPFQPTPALMGLPTNLRKPVGVGR